MGVGGGQCLVLARRKDGTNGWSLPSFCGIGEASIGLQVGIQKLEVMLLIMNDEALQHITSGTAILGGEVGLSVGLIGSSVESLTTLNLDYDIVAFARSQGFYGGIVLDGGYIGPDKTYNGAYYGRPITAREILFGNRLGKFLTAQGARIFRPGNAEGKVIGGCLTLLCRSLGTPWEVKTRNKILLLEDVNEPLYKIDGMLCHLKQAGKFNGVRGIVFGEMVNCQSFGPDRRNKESGSFKGILRDVFANGSFPILTNFPSGHGREMLTLPMGVEARLDTKNKTLEFENCGVL